MGKINFLQQEDIRKISAGEVVDRPATVVKELIENSLDAGATSVSITVENAGLKSISVLDNGQGMDSEDLEKCFKPYATSKISSFDDLLDLRSFGFRGEALHAIGSVSRLTISSRQKGKSGGNSVSVEAGGFSNAQKKGMSVGTEVLVNDLFFNVPARLKFLKNSNTEFRHIADVVINYALSYYEVSFKLIHNGKEILSVPAKQTLSERVHFLFGGYFSGNLIPFNYTSDYFTLTGYVSKPQLASELNIHQHLFVNNRWVTDSALSRNIKNAYASFIESKTFPPFILFINVESNLVDVNVHPRKEVVHFSGDIQLYSTVNKAVLQALQEISLGYEDISYDDTADKFLSDKVKEDVAVWDFDSQTNNEEILQYQKLFLIYQEGSKLVFIDQHAAHERIIYEQLHENIMNNEGIMNTIEPTTDCIIELTASEALLLEDYLDIFLKIGIEIQPFGKRTYKIAKIPALLQTQNVAQFIKEILSDLKNEQNVRNLNTKTLNTLAFISCRSAIKAGHYLDPEERKELVEKLSETKSNYTCPHGRPVKITFSASGLEKIFKRIK